MIITALKPDKKHLTRLIFADGGEQLLDNDVLAESSVTVALKCSIFIL